MRLKVRESEIFFDSDGPRQLEIYLSTFSGLDAQLEAYWRRSREGPVRSKSNSIAESGVKFPDRKSPICFASLEKDYTFAKVS